MQEEKIIFDGKELSLLEKAVIFRLRSMREYERIEIKHTGYKIVVDYKQSTYEQFPIVRTS